MIRVTGLYFEPLKEEYIFNIIKKEKEKGNLSWYYCSNLVAKLLLELAKFLYDNKLPILGTQYANQLI